MSIKKTYRFLGLMILALTLVLMPGVSRAAMWVGGEIGGNFMANANIKVGNATIHNIKFDPQVIGGITMGYDFVNAGFLGYAWPDWMKYFSVAADFTYNQLNLTSLGNIATNSNVSGHAAVLTFLFMAHYGFMPDSEVPSGRINPYIGVGPAIVFSEIDFTLPVARATLNTNSRFGASATNVALVVEPGIRWVALKNVSIDTAFRWRYMVPSWTAGANTLKLDPLNQWSFLVRANLHF